MLLTRKQRKRIMADPVISASGREYSGGVSDLTPALSPWAHLFAPSSPSGVANPNYGFLSPHFDARVQGQMLTNKIGSIQGTLPPVSPLIMGESGIGSKAKYTVGNEVIEEIGEEDAYRLNNWRASDPGGGALRNIERGGFIDPFRPMTENEYDAAVHYIGGQHRSPLVGGLTKGYTTFEALAGRDKAKEKIRDDYADYMSNLIGPGKSLNEVIQAGLSLPDYLDVRTYAKPEQQLQDYVDIQDYVDDQFTVGDDAEASLFPLGYTTGVDPFQTNEDTLQSFFNIPEVTPIGTDSGTVIVEDTPEGTILTDNTPVDVMPWGAGEQYMDAQGFETVMPDLSIPFDPADESEVFGTFDSTTPGQIGDYLRAQEQEFMLPSGPEEMTEVFTEEDKIAEDERKRIAEIEAREEEERARLQKIADDNRARREADERQAKKLREEAAEAEDRQDKARLSREADERERQAKEKEAEEQAARENLRIAELAAASDKLAREKEERDKKATRQQLKELEEFMARQAADRAFRKKQQASMPKSWSFF
jgi:hypothetical protein